MNGKTLMAAFLLCLSLSACADSVPEDAREGSCVELFSSPDGAPVPNNVREGKVFTMEATKTGMSGDSVSISGSKGSFVEGPDGEALFVEIGETVALAFSPDIPVFAPDGSKTDLEDIRVGDIVEVSMDTESGDIILASLVDVSKIGFNNGIVFDTE